MSRILHLLRWDVRRFRVLLSLWLLLVAASAALEGAWPGIAVAMAARNTVGLTGNLLAFAEVLFSVALITLVVQEQPLVGTTAFWMTRPIPPGALLVEKLVLLSAALVLAPVLAEVVLMSVYSVPAEEIASVAAQSALFWGLWLAIVMVFAALTPNMARFALAVSGAIVAIIVSIVTISAILIDRVNERPPIPMAVPTHDPTADVVSTMLLIGVVLMLLAILYRTRARPRAIAIGLAGLVFAVAVGNVWSWPFLAPAIETPSWALDESTLQLSAGPGAVDVGNTLAEFGVPPPAWRVARAQMRLRGLEPGWSAGVGVRETSIRVNGREALTSRLRGAPASVAIDDVQSVPNREVVRRLLNVGRLVVWMQQTKPESAVVLVARTADLRRVAADRGTYEGTFQVTLVRHDIAAVLPLRAGAAASVGPYQFAVDSIQLLPSRIQILARESDVHSVFDRHPRSRIDYYLRNRQTSQAVQGSHRELRTDVTLSRFIPFIIGVGQSETSGFRALAVEMSFSTGYGGEEEVVFDRTWLSRSEVVIVRTTDGGAVERRVSIADFPIPAE